LSPRPPAAIRLVLAPARAWAAAVSAVHGAAAVAAILWLPGAAAAAACAGLALSGWLGTGSALLRGPHAVREVELRADGSAAFVDARGEWQSAVVESAASLGHRFAALRLRAGAARRSIVLVPGAVDPDAFRRARVWLRWRLPAA